jgi:hypothetical protein
LLRGAAAWQDAPPRVRAQAIELFRQRVAELRQPVHERLEAAIRERQDADREPIWNFVGMLALAGPLLLVLPLFRWHVYPGRRLRLCFFSAVSAVLFSLTIALFCVPLALYLTLGEEVALSTDPRLRVLDASFDFLEEQGERCLGRRRAVRRLCVLVLAVARVPGAAFSPVLPCPHAAADAVTMQRKGRTGDRARKRIPKGIG